MTLDKFINKYLKPETPIIVAGGKSARKTTVSHLLETIDVDFSVEVLKVKGFGNNEELIIITE